MSSDKLTTEDSDWQATAYEQFLREDSHADIAFEEAWTAEVERRNDEAESGRVPLTTDTKH